MGSLCDETPPLSFLSDSQVDITEICREESAVICFGAIAAIGGGAALN
jgi:hypothetical protein